MITNYQITVPLYNGKDQAKIPIKKVYTDYLCEMQ